MELKPTYNKKGEQRAYYIGDDGREYFMYEDKRTGYIIREMSKDDIDDWFKAMKCENSILSPMQKVINKALVAQQVKKMIEEENNAFVTMKNYIDDDYYKFIKDFVDCNVNNENEVSNGHSLSKKMRKEEQCYELMKSMLSSHMFWKKPL